MLYPTELRAQPDTRSGDLDYSGNSGVDDEDAVTPPRFPAYRNCITVGSKHFLFQDFNNFLAPFMHTASAHVNLSHHRQFLLCTAPPLTLYFQALAIGKSGATGTCRRSGAQRGALEDKLRPEVFLDAPCIFSSLGFIWPTADLPQSSPLADELSRRPELFLDVQPRLSQQSRNHRLFEA